MPKVTGPLFSLKASGSVGKKLTFSNKFTGQQVRNTHWPKKTITLDQWTQRHIMGLLTAHWQVMTDNEKAVYNDYVTEHNLNMSGFNRFIQLAQTDLKTYHGLVGYWACNQKTGGTLIDNSGNGNNGTLMPAPMGNSPQYVDAMIKQYGKALSFDGIDDYVNCGNDITLDEPKTIEFWFKTSVGTTGLLITKSETLANNNKTWNIFIENNKVVFRVSDPSQVANKEVKSLSNVNDNEWHYCVISRDTSNIVNLYVDCCNESFDDFSSYDFSNNLDVIFGTRTILGFYYSGLLDEIRFYNRCLTTSEILKHYNLLRQNKNRQNPGKFIG